MNLPEPVLEVLLLLEKNGFESYVVGGAVRDEILGLHPQDFDITTSASVEQMTSLFSNYKVIETGIKHGTITIHYNHFEMEITEFRGDVLDLKEDLVLRDFTINSMAFSPSKGLIDHVNGQLDLKNRILRLNTNGEDIIQKDPLRILRGIRLSSKLNLNVSNETKMLFFKHKDKLKNIAMERVGSELEKILLSKNVDEALMTYKDILSVVIPELKPMFDFDQLNPYHIYDVFEHTVKVVMKTPQNRIVRLAALFHDIGKPNTFSIDSNGIGHFYGHPKESSILLKKILKRLKFSKNTISKVNSLVMYHDYNINNTPKSIKKFLSKFDISLINELFELKKADVLAQNPKFYHRLQELKNIKDVIDQLLTDAECISIKQLEITGYDLLNLGYKEGPLLSTILNDLLSVVIQGDLKNSKNDLIEYVIKTYKND